MHFDLTDLRLLVNVDVAGTITGGAAATHMTLASASERIRGMEAMLGAPLLLRGHRGVRPTPAGRTVLHHARLVVRQIEQLQGDLVSYGGGVQVLVRVLCNTSALDEHLPLAISRFLAARPAISVDLEERSSAEIGDALRNDLGDIGIAADSADLGDLETFPWRADPLVVVAARDHPLAQARATRLAALVEYPFIGLVEGSALDDHVAAHARRLGRVLGYRVRLRTFEAVCRLAGQGVGIAVVPRAVAVRCGREAGIASIALADPWAARKLMICVRRRDRLAAPAESLLVHLLRAEPTAGAGEE